MQVKYFVAYINHSRHFKFCGQISPLMPSREILLFCVVLVSAEKAGGLEMDAHKLRQRLGSEFKSVGLTCGYVQCCLMGNIDLKPGDLEPQQSNR